ncbi:hypothetical protein [Streptomyces sp. JL7001]|uniref:hypothetical protein n=1 Tax=Streptomyces sp. JL7001 TaxID=3445784 RepID=UPI003F796E12
MTVDRRRRSRNQHGGRHRHGAHRSARTDEKVIISAALRRQPVDKVREAARPLVPPARRAEILERVPPDGIRRDGETTVNGVRLASRGPVNLIKQALDNATNKAKRALVGFSGDTRSCTMARTPTSMTNGTVRERTGRRVDAGDSPLREERADTERLGRSLLSFRWS